MTQVQDMPGRTELEGLVRGDREWYRAVVQRAVQEALEAEMDEALGARKHERCPSRLGYRSGYYTRNLVTRVGSIEIRVPQDRDGRFSTEIFERYQRSEKALVAALSEMYLQGVSTRKIRKVTEELCGHAFSASSISRLVKQLDVELRRFATRPLEEPYPYLILDARFEKVRDQGVVRSQAVLIAIGIDLDGRRSVLAVELAHRENELQWRELLAALKARGLTGVEFVVSDDHAGLRRAIGETLTQAVWQRCYVHFLRNLRDRFPRKPDDDCFREVCWIYERRTLTEARRDLAAWLDRWQTKYPTVCAWVEDNIEETFSFFRLPQPHHKHLKSSNMLERFNEEIRRRTHVIRIFPNGQSCLRLVRAIAVETNEAWLEGTRYLNMRLLAEHKRTLLREGDTAAA